MLNHSQNDKDGFYFIDTRVAHQFVLQDDTSASLVVKFKNVDKPSKHTLYAQATSELPDVSSPINTLERGSDQYEKCIGEMLRCLNNL